MQLTVQEISGILTIAVVVLTVLGVLKSRKSQKIDTPRSEPIFKTEPKISTLSLDQNVEYQEKEAIQLEIFEEDFENEPQITEQDPEKTPTAPQVISVTLLAEKNRPYGGHELLQALLSNGMRFGKMDIFHYHKDGNSNSPALFSCASAKKPGTFDIKNMSTFKTPGLTFFIQLDPKIDNAAALDVMLSTADIVVYDLGGHLIDDQLKILSDEKIAQWRRQIRKFKHSTQEIPA